MEDNSNMCQLERDKLTCLGDENCGECLHEFPILANGPMKISREFADYNSLLIYHYILQCPVKALIFKIL